MTLMQPIEIRASKKKLILSLIGSIAFVAVGIWLITGPEIEMPILGNPVFVMITGYTCVAFFGLIAIVLIGRLGKPLKGLTLSSEGIEDHSTAVSAGFIPWTDIKEIREAKTFNQQFIVVVVHNPQEYIDRQGNFIKRKSVQSNYKIYGSPVTIATAPLDAKFEDVKRALQEQLYNFKNRHLH
jgi:hypothetical protein